MRRHALGIISAIMISAGIYMLFRYGIDSNKGMYAGIFLRAGLVLGATWLALPQILDLLTRFPPWLIACCLIVFGVIVIKPRLFVIVGPLVAGIAIIQLLGWLLKPLPKQKRKRSAAEASKPVEPRRAFNAGNSKQD